MAERVGKRPGVIDKLLDDYYDELTYDERNFLTNLNLNNLPLTHDQEQRIKDIEERLYGYGYERRDG